MLIEDINIAPIDVISMLVPLLENGTFLTIHDMLPRQKLERTPPLPPFPLLPHPCTRTRVSYDVSGIWPYFGAINTHTNEEKTVLSFKFCLRTCRVPHLPLSSSSRFSSFPRSRGFAVDSVDRVRRLHLVVLARSMKNAYLVICDQGPCGR